MFKMKKAVFLDRDGVILKFVDHLYRKEDVELIPDSDNAIRLLNENDYLVVGVMNQPVVARGLCTLEEVEEINNYMLELLRQRGASMDKLYFCPHHPEAGDNPEYTRDCNCRKPKIGMLLEGKRYLGISLEDSYVIGDNTMDIKMGKDAGCKTILVETGYGGRDSLFQVEPRFRAADLYEAVSKIILRN